MSKAPLFYPFLISLLIWTPCCTDQVDHETSLLVGFSQVNITPPIGMRLCGSFDEMVNTRVHDSLFVRAIVFKQGKTTFALAGCDLAMVFPEITDSVRKLIAIEGLPPENILIHATETHNGPDYFGEFRDVFHQRSMQALGYDPLEPIDYSKFLIAKICTAIKHAEQNLFKADLRHGVGKCEGIAFNRRYRLKDGTIGWNPGKLNPLIDTVLGPIDPSVPVLTLHHRDENVPVGIISGFAMHLALMESSLDYTADYPYFIDQALKAKVKPELFTHFLQSPCCEVNHIDVTSSEPQTGYEWAEIVGNRIANTIENTLKHASLPITPKLKCLSEKIDLALQEFSNEEIEAQRRIWHSPERSSLKFLDVVHAGKVANIYDRHHGGPVSVLIQAVQLAENTVIVGLPSEVSVVLGLSLKEQSPYENTFALQLSNDWLGYIPHQKIFEEGHYEAVVAKIKSGEGEYLINETVEMLNRLKSSR